MGRGETDRGKRRVSVSNPALVKVMAGSFSDFCRMQQRPVNTTRIGAWAPCQAVGTSRANTRKAMLVTHAMCPLQGTKRKEK